MILKTELDVSGSNFSNILLNENPLFVNYLEDNYQLLPVSPAKDSGDTQWIFGIPDLQIDIKEVDRSITPDLGAYEVE